MTEKFTITWKGSRRSASVAPNPDFPNGVTLDFAKAPDGSERKGCLVGLDYPAPEVGAWIIDCTVCGVRVGVTAAGRVDDPWQVKIPCRAVAET